VLERTWRSWNSYTPPVGMENGIAILENRSAAPQKVKQRVTIWLSHFTPR